MKKVLSIILAVAVLAACGDPLSMLTGSTNANFELGEELWAVSGFTAPYGQQEIHRLHYDSPDDGLVPAEVSFKGGKLTLVFPSGAYRTVGYTLDRQAKTITFDAPITYGCTVRTNGQEYVGKDITFAKYDMMTISMAFPGTQFKGEGKFFSIYDPSASSFSDVDIEKQQWRIAMVNMTQHNIKPLYEIAGEHGTMDRGSNLGVDGASKWAGECVYENALFPYIDGVDLCTVHYGADWHTPTEAEAQWLLDNCDLRKTMIQSTGNYGMYFIAKETSRGLQFPIGEVNEELGFWLSNGKAMVFKLTGPQSASDTQAQIISPEKDAKYFLRAVRSK